jgi:hypothetical protein
MGNPFVHMELATDDVKAAQKFYKKVFDWKITELGADMGNYTLINTGSRLVGGGMGGKMSPSQPTAWTVYAEVASVKTSLGKAVKAGAKVVMPYQPIGEMGAIGIFVDPTGASFGVWEKGKKAPAKKKAKSKK